MKKNKGLPEDYYKQTFCRRCKEPVPKKQLEKCKKEGFLVLCDKCYPMIKEQLAKCLPLFKRFRGV